MVHEGVDRINLAQDVLVNKITNLRVPYEEGSVLKSEATLSFPTKEGLHFMQMVCDTGLGEHKPVTIPHPLH
jgi:hypothetical protein